MYCTESENNCIFCVKPGKNAMGNKILFACITDLGKLKFCRFESWSRMHCYIYLSVAIKVGKTSKS